MKLHIENLNVTITHQPPVGLIAGMALASAAKFAAPSSIPDIGDKWPGTEATYAGVSLSLSGDSLEVHALTREGADELLAGDMDRRVAGLERGTP